MALNCSREKVLCGCDVSVLAQQEINRVALLIDRTVEVLPLSTYTNIGFILSPRPAGWMGKAIPPLLELRNIALYPSEDQTV